MVNIPPRPPTFSVDLAPLGVEVKFVDFVGARPTLIGGKARSILVHTNAARKEGSIESAWNHSHAVPNENTVPTYQVDMSHNGITRARKFLPSNLRPIANATATKTTKFQKDGPLIWPTLASNVQADILEHGNIRDWSLAIETADTGTDDDPTISEFDPGQTAVVSAIIAYESIVHGFPLKWLDAWHGGGVGTHTAPFPFPFTTIKQGKFCPGDKKKDQTKNIIIPNAILIRDAWLNKPRTPDDPTPKITPPNIVPGERSNNVFELQKLLIRIRLVADTPGNRDHHYGLLTQAVIKKFQIEHGIESNAEVGPKTWSALFAVSQ